MSSLKNSFFPSITRSLYTVYNENSMKNCLHKIFHEKIFNTHWGMHWKHRKSSFSPCQEEVTWQLLRPPEPWKLLANRSDKVKKRRSKNNLKTEGCFHPQMTLGKSKSQDEIERSRSADPVMHFRQSLTLELKLLSFSVNIPHIKNSHASTLYQHIPFMKSHAVKFDINNH